MHVFEYPANITRQTYSLYHPEKGNYTQDDPRYSCAPGQDSSSWTMVYPDEVGMDVTRDDPEIPSLFRHKTTGELVDSDP
jgi:hypothetical protein